MTMMMTCALIQNHAATSRSRRRETLALLLALPLVLLLAGCTHTLTVQLGGAGSGSVSSSPAGISCGAGGTACSDTTNDGTPFLLTATPSRGSVFAGWGGACSGAAPTCFIDLTASFTAVAYFRTTQVSTGAYHTCALKMDGTVWCWGRNNEGELGRGTNSSFGADFPTQIVNLANVVQVAAGGYHTCAMLAGGAVQCWGRNTEDQVGEFSDIADPITAPRPIRTTATVPGLSIAAGGYHSCEVMSDGTVMCWGANNAQQITAGTFGQIAWATPAAGVGGAVAATAGAYHSCALLSNGIVNCWGYNNDGESGISPGPFNVVPLSATQIDASMGAGLQATTAQGGYHTCALLKSGGITCWGFNGHGELGTGNTFGPQPTGLPVGVMGLPGAASAVASGGYHTCAIVSGSVLCWGADESAQLGRGTSGTDILSPGLVSPLLPTAVSVDAGGYHTCAVFSGSTDDVRCWGRNTEGQCARTSNNGHIDPVPSPMKSF
ncbi:MAG TPA: hypothetical protein VMH04_23840 [Candidatus Solibacter sp.]|nr:hypothetical protein [Candidatus Solibacter sp.]